MTHSPKAFKFNQVGAVFAAINFSANLVTIFISFVDQTIGIHAPIVVNPFLWNFPSFIVAVVINGFFRNDILFYLVMLVAGASQWYIIGWLLSKLVGFFKKGIILNRTGLIVASINIFANIAAIFLTYAVYGDHYRRSGGIGWLMIYPLMWNFPSTILTVIFWKISRNESLAMVIMVIAGAFQWYLLGTMFSKIVGYFRRLLVKSTHLPSSVPHD